MDSRLGDQSFDIGIWGLAVSVYKESPCYGSLGSKKIRSSTNIPLVSFGLATRFRVLAWTEHVWNLSAAGGTLHRSPSWPEGYSPVSLPFGSFQKSGALSMDPK